MTAFLLAEFTTAHDTAEAARAAAAAGMPAQDVLSPNPIDGITDYLAPPQATAPIGGVMVVAGTLGAIAGYAMQWYSSVIDYPIDSGGRPLDSWQAFLLVPYEIAILSCGIVGTLAWLAMCGLPRLHHPLFAAAAVERAAQDRYFLVFRHSGIPAAWVGANLHPHAMHEIRE